MRTYRIIRLLVVGYVRVVYRVRVVGPGTSSHGSGGGAGEEEVAGLRRLFTRNQHGEKIVLRRSLAADAAPA